MENTTIQVPVLLPLTMFKDLERIKRKERRSRSQLMVVLLDEALEARKQKREAGA